MAWHLLLHADDYPLHQGIEQLCLFQRLFGSPFPGHQFDHGNQVRRVHWMRHKDTRWIARALLYVTGAERRRAGGDHDISSDRLLDLRNNVSLRFKMFRTILLHVIHVSQRRVALSDRRSGRSIILG